MLFTDESTFRLFQGGRRVWRRPGEQVVRRSVKHSPKLHVWGCVSTNGFGKIYIFQKNLKAELLIKIYEEALLPSAEQLFDGPWILQEDNDPKHKSKKAASWRETNQVVRLAWPAQSPDQNCIENVWRILKINEAAQHPGTLQELAKVIRQEWKKLPQELATTLVKSMERRVQALIEAEGDYTLY